MAIFKRSIKSDPEINLAQILYLEHIIDQNEFLDCEKMLAHIEIINAALHKTYNPLIDQIIKIEDSMLKYAHALMSEASVKLDTIELLDNKKARVQRSIDCMKPIIEKKDEVKRILDRNASRALIRIIHTRFFKSLPLSCSMILTLALDYYNALFEQIVRNRNAHFVVLVGLFFAQAIVFDHFFDILNKKIMNYQVRKYILILKSDYNDLDAVTNELKQRLEENEMPEIFA